MTTNTTHDLASSKDSPTALSQKLKELQPNKRISNQVKLQAHYDAIIDAIGRGVSMKTIREVLAESGISLSAATLKRLLSVEVERRKRDRFTSESNSAGEEEAA